VNLKFASYDFTNIPNNHMDCKLSYIYVTYDKNHTKKLQFCNASVNTLSN